MTAYTRLLRLFLQSIALKTGTVLFFAISFAYVGYLWFSSNLVNAEYHILGYTLEISLFAFLFFAFVSYEFFFKIKQAFLDETIRSMRWGYFSFFTQGLAVLFSILFLYFSVFFSADIIVLSHLGEEFIWHIILNLLCNLLFIPIVGILIGAGIATIEKRITSVTVLLVFCLLTSPLPNSLAFLLYESSHVSIFPLLYFFQMTSPDLKTMTPSFGYSLLSYRWQLLAFWIFLMLAYLLHHSLKNNRSRIKSAAIVLCTLLFSVSLFYYLQPSSKVLLDSMDLKSGAVADQDYYYRNEQRDESADFKITEYNMELSIRRLLKANVQLTIDNPNLPEYRFTLYHGYRVKSIRNTAGEKLRFVQDGDYITLQNPNKTNCGVLTFIYAGSSSRFYSNSQSTVLPGYFPYYPHSGFSAIYNTELYGTERLLLAENTPFRITVDSPRTIYCNLPSVRHNVFAGESNGVTLISGFLKQLTTDGVTVVYPYLGTPEEYNEENIVNDYIPNAFRKGILDDTTKAVFVLPGTNMPSAYDKTAKFSDHLLIPQFWDLHLYYQDQIVNSKKALLDQIVSTYVEFPDMFQEMLETEKETNKVSQGSGLYRFLLSEKIQELGVGYVLERCERYISDDADTRSIQDFLSQLSGQEE